MSDKWYASEGLFSWTLVSPSGRIFKLDEWRDPTSTGPLWNCPPDSAALLARLAQAMNQLEGRPASITTTGNELPICEAHLKSIEADYKQLPEALSCVVCAFTDWQRSRRTG